jgi:hypothetical protein
MLDESAGVWIRRRVIKSSKGPKTQVPKDFPTEQREILKLRRELRELNRKRDFQSSKDLHQQIRDLCHSNEKEAVDAVLKPLGEEIARTFDEHRMVVGQLEEEFRTREGYLRQSIDDSFDEMGERHVQVLTELELLSAQESIRAELRETSNVTILQRISVYLADMAEFDQAMATINEADAVQRSETSDRKRTLEIRVGTITAHVLAKFDREIALLEDRLAKGLKGISDQLDAEIGIQQKQCSVTIQRTMLQATHQAIKQVGKKGKETEISAKITQFTRTRAVKNGMNEKLAFD